MKIIISESQYNLLLESNFEKNKRLVGKMWDEGMKIGEITELIGLNEEQVILLHKDKPIKIDCGFAERLTTLLFWRTDFIRKEYSFNDGETTLEFTWGGFSGIIYFTYENKEVKLVGMASPYWNGDCSIPVDTDYFENKLDGEEDDANFSDMTLNNVPSKFNSIQELIDFLNNDYPKELIKKIPKLISLYV
jgi:hypothetical protein